MNEMLFIIYDLKIKPYVRMTQKSKFYDPQAKEYLASKEALSWEFKRIMQQYNFEMLPKVPIKAEITIWVPSSVGHRQDIDKGLKGTLLERA